MAKLALAALGVVYGDIGTSPLYALRECFNGEHGVQPTPQHVLGVLSLIFWSLIIIVSIKYLVFILRADNAGEGGILALATLLSPKPGMSASQRRKLILTLGLFGASLLYADGIVTPAISVLSAVEGLTVATPIFDRFVIPLTLIILVGLFMVQKHGTKNVGRIFGPVTFLWFMTLAVIGISWIVRRPDVLVAVNPLLGLEFVTHIGFKGFIILGAVFLVVTGGEALYADLGHFGPKPIRAAWFTIVLPCLLLNYFGQGALLLANPAAASHPFFEAAPTWALYPLVLLATCATVIASQALITGAYSLTMQAIQLGLCPRLAIEHTSAESKGQIYVPAINWALMFACLALVVGFRSSSNLVAAYGLSISITMVITTILFYLLAVYNWHWPIYKALPLCLFFLTLECSYLAANMLKFKHGGWFPLVVALCVFTLMSTWRWGRALMAERMKRSTLPLDLFLDDVRRTKPQRVPGTAVFMSGNPTGTPLALLHNLKHNRVLHERVVVLNISSAPVPHIKPADRVKVEKLDEMGVYLMTMTFGFMDAPEVISHLRRVHEQGLDFKLMETSFFLGRETLFISEGAVWKTWRVRLFAWMARNARNPVSFFNLPPNRVVELGTQVDLKLGRR